MPRVLWIIAYSVTISVLALAIKEPIADAPQIAGVDVGLNPAARVWDNARHFWTTGHLERSDYAAIHSEMIARSKTNGGYPLWQDIYALSKEGKYYPKHQHFFLYLGAASYGLFAEYGAWVLHTLSLSLLLGAIYSLAERWASRRSSFLLVLLLPFLDKWIRASIGARGEIAYDMLGTSLLFGALAVSARKPFAAGLIFGLSLTMRLSWLVFSLLPFAFSPRPSLHATIRLFAGFFGSFLLVAVYNYYFFGDALTGQYSRLPIYQNGEMSFDRSSHYYSLSFLKELVPRLFSTEDGWLIAAPYLIPAFILLAAPGFPRELRHASLTAFVLFAPTFIYVCWFGCQASRYMLPGTIFLSLPLAWGFDRFLPATGTARPRNPQEPRS